MGARLGRLSPVSATRRVALIVAGTALLAGGLSAVPGAAAGDESEDAPTVVSASKKNDAEGSASSTAAALAKAQETDERVEVKSERTEKVTVWANPDGTLTRDVAVAPVRAKNSVGDLVPIDTELAATRGRLSPNATTGNVSFSGDGSGSLAVYDLTKSQSVALAFKGDLGDPSVKGSTARYAAKPEPEPEPEPEPAPSPTTSSPTRGRRIFG
jgi:hypothetical protein